MGKVPPILLVTAMSLRRLMVLLAPLMLVACQEPAKPDLPRVKVGDYDAFYLWPGVHPAKGLRSKTLYLLDGEVRRDGSPQLTQLRMGLPRLPGKAVWLVVRTDRLDWNEAVYASILADLNRWKEAGNKVEGLQIDFDAATRGIDGYARFLADLRQRLPSRWRLSVTGLMDWSAHGDPQALVRLSHVIDEVVVQTYQGQTTIPGYEAYFRRMDHFPIPFRVALVEGGAWRPPATLARHPQFSGYVVFLLAPQNRKGS